jgi:hypothetical protein
VVKFLGEFSKKFWHPYRWNMLMDDPAEVQLKDHQRFIDEYWTRYLVNGGKGLHHSPEFRRNIEHKNRRIVKKQLYNMLQNVEQVDDIEIPKFKYDADYDWF